MRKLNSNPNVDNSDLTNYPDGRIKDNSGVGDGTYVNERVYGDIHSMKEKLMRLYGIIANNLPDNETNGYQLIDALIALASKNDFVLDLTTSGGVLQIPLKVSLMKIGESLVCKAAANKSTETTIRGVDNSVTSVSFIGDFKANEYVRFIKTSAGVTLVRITDSASVNTMVSELSFLKKASQAQENAGAVDTVSTTPLVNKVAFELRVNGADSAGYLATAARNGLYPKEHFTIVANLGASPVKNTGWFSGFDVGGSSGALPVSGNITGAASVQDGNGESTVTVTMQNAMSNTNYFVRIFLQSQNSNIRIDTNVYTPVFVPVSTTQFRIGFRENGGVAQSLKVHLEVVQL